MSTATTDPRLDRYSVQLVPIDSIKPSPENDETYGWTFAISHRGIKNGPPASGPQQGAGDGAILQSGSISDDLRILRRRNGRRPPCGH